MGSLEVLTMNKDTDFVEETVKMIQEKSLKKHISIHTKNEGVCFNCGSKMDPEYNCPTCNGWDELMDEVPTEELQGDKALHDMYRFKHNYAECPDCEMDLTDRVKPTCEFGVHDGRFIPSNNNPENVPEHVPDKYKHKLFAMNISVNGTEKSAEDVPSSDSSLLSFITLEGNYNMQEMKALPEKATTIVERVCATCGVLQRIAVTEGFTPKCLECKSTKLMHIPDDETYFAVSVDRSAPEVVGDKTFGEMQHYKDVAQELGAHTWLKPKVGDNGELVTKFDKHDNVIPEMELIFDTTPLTANDKSVQLAKWLATIPQEPEKKEFIPNGYTSMEQWVVVKKHLANRVFCKNEPTMLQRNTCKKYFGVDPVAIKQNSWSYSELSRYMKAYFWAKKNNNVSEMEKNARIIKSGHPPYPQPKYVSDYADDGKTKRDEGVMRWGNKYLGTYDIDALVKSPWARKTAKDYDPINLEMLLDEAEGKGKEYLG